MDYFVHSTWNSSDRSFVEMWGDLVNEYRELMWVITNVTLMTSCIIFPNIFCGNAHGIISGIITSMFTFYVMGILAKIKFKK